MKLEDLKGELLARDSLNFCERVLFDPLAWIDGKSVDGTIFSYPEFRDAIGRVISVDPNDIFLVGSAKFGVSLKPTKEALFRPFNENSDLDVAIISEELFDDLHAGLLAAYYHAGLTWVKRRHNDDVFRRFITLCVDGNYKTRYLRDYVAKLDEMGVEALRSTGVTRPFKYRVYKCFDAALQYHTASIDDVKRQLQ